MAIDDNTSYELTGYQVKDLAGRIRLKADTSSLAPVASSGDFNDLTNKPDLSGYVTVDTAQDVTGAKTFKSVTNIQNGQGTGSLWIGGNVNASGATNNTRHLARISVPSYSDVSLAATMLGFDTSGDSDMHVANKSTDALSFGGMKKITNATSPMAIGFCVANTRGATAAANKVYPLEMDANQARFNVRPNYNGTNLALSTDIPTVNNATLTIQKNGTDVQTFTANSSTNKTANITVPTALSELTGTISSSQIADEAVTSSKIDWTTLGAPANGYLQLGTVKIQWGVNTVTMNGTSAGSFGVKTVTLNTNMSGTNYAVVVTPQDPGSTNALKITAQGKQTGQFSVTAGTAATSGSATITFSWIVIGV